MGDQAGLSSTYHLKIVRSGIPVASFEVIQRRSVGFEDGFLRLESDPQQFLVQEYEPGGP